MDACDEIEAGRARGIRSEGVRSATAESGNLGTSNPSSPPIVDRFVGVILSGVVKRSLDADSRVRSTVDGVLTGGEAADEILPDEGRGGEKRLPRVERGVGGREASLAASLIFDSHWLRTKSTDLALRL